MLKLIQKLSSLKKVAPLAKQSAYACHAKFEQSVSSMRWHTMSALEFGAGYQSANVVASSADQRNAHFPLFSNLPINSLKYFLSQFFSNFSFDGSRHNSVGQR